MNYPSINDSGSFVNKYIGKNAKSNTDAARFALDSFREHPGLTSKYIMLLVVDHNGYDPVAYPRKGFYRIDYGKKNINHLLRDGPIVLFEKTGACDDDLSVEPGKTPPCIVLQKVNTHEMITAYPYDRGINSVKKMLQDVYEETMRNP